MADIRRCDGGVQRFSRAGLRAIIARPLMRGRALGLGALLDCMPAGLWQMLGATGPNTPLASPPPGMPHKWGDMGVSPTDGPQKWEWVLPGPVPWHPSPRPVRCLPLGNNPH